MDRGLYEMKIKDYLSSLEIVETPEEKNRQIMLKRLVEDFHYSKSLLVKEYRVKRSPSDTRKSLPVDIAVFDNDNDR